MGSRSLTRGLNPSSLNWEHEVSAMDCQLSPRCFIFACGHFQWVHMWVRHRELLITGKKAQVKGWGSLQKRIREKAKMQRWTSGIGQTLGQYIRGCRREVVAICRRPWVTQYHGIADTFGGICSAHADILDCSLLFFLSIPRVLLWHPWLYMTPYPEFGTLHWVWALDPITANENPSP